MVIATAQKVSNDGGGDFAFDLADDLEIEMAAPFPAKREITAIVGKVLHIVVPKDIFSKDVKGYEVRKDNSRQALLDYSLFLSLRLR